MIPLCYRCNHKATSHSDDGVELAECMEGECGCTAWETSPDGLPIYPAKISVRRPDRFVWKEPDGIWDDRLKCWVVWRGIGGGWYTTERFRALAMRAMNEHPAMEEYDR